MTDLTLVYTYSIYIITSSEVNFTAMLRKSILHNKTHCGVLVVFNGQEVVMLVQVKNQFSYKTKLLVWIGSNLMLGVFKVFKTNVVV